MTATAGLTSDLQKQVLLLEDDLRIRLQGDSERLAGWQTEHVEAVTRERTASSWVEWRDDRVTQVAVAWVLTTVFVRFCEDNGLVRPVWIAGPALRRQEALDAQLAFFRTHPEDTDREWLKESVDYLAGMPSTGAVVDSHSALYLVSPSGDAATALLAFWRRKDDNGELIHDLTDSTLSTRFLGDLYQDLSEYAKKTFALLQTPVFVEEFILDQTLEPALAERPLEGFKLIDPTCGSGHFLLGAFARLLARWDKQVPGLEIQARVQQALDSIHGVDLNPFAVAIARFRLTVAALQACGLSSLEQAPAFRFHLAAGDSLLHGQDQGALSFDNFDADSALSGFAYATEDLALLREILQPGRYDVVVGNPPYITVKDKTLNKAYREIYTTCKGKYALTVPFMERFFGLAKPGTENQPAGWVGQITSNSFMKREFGSKLIEDFLPRKDLRLVADTSGAFIPGHATPTVILVARNQGPLSQKIRAVLATKGENQEPENPAKGVVWRSLVDHVGEPGWDDGWITIVDLDRNLLATHPWSLSGGGAIALMERVEGTSPRRLREVVAEIGVMAVIGEEEAFELRPGALEPSIPMILGEGVRDFVLHPVPRFWPYDGALNVTPEARASRTIWPFRTVVSGYLMFGKTREERGLEWLEYGMLAKAKLRTPMAISFAFVATHNHFVLDRGGKIFNRTAPVVKLLEGATEDEHLALLGLLNSSTACFWLKQVSFDKGSGGNGRGLATEQWEHGYEFGATSLRELPLPSSLRSERGSILDRLGRELSTLSPSSIVAGQAPQEKVLADARADYECVQSQMISQQEELDWEFYGLYDLIAGDLSYHGDDLPAIALGERAFEIALARGVLAGEVQTVWFSRHGSTAITEIPAQWPAAYRELVQRRLELIVSDPSIRLLENPEYKRRWVSESWEKQQQVALGGWLLERLEDRRFWFDSQGRPSPRSLAQLADEVARDTDLVSVFALWEGRPDAPIVQSLHKLLVNQAVPFLAAHRLKDPGLRKREAWEESWALQRRQDAGEKVGPIPVPPKYTSADFRNTSWWQARGKLDVPKERFILYPDAGRETDPTPLLGWAGWDHAQQSLALSLIIGAREADGWDDDRLVTLVAGLAELQPWVEQWHADVDPTYGVSLAAFCREQLTTRASQVGKSLEELAAWRPVTPTRGRRPRTGATS